MLLAIDQMGARARERSIVSSSITRCEVTSRFVERHPPLEQYRVAKQETILSPDCITRRRVEKQMTDDDLLLVNVIPRKSRAPVNIAF